MPEPITAGASPALPPAVMGILNVTPDSFSDGGELADVAHVVARAEQHVDEGATWLDLGAESTRPGATLIDADTELYRLLPALDALCRANLPARISVDTRKACVARVALEHGAQAINDVSALADPQMAAVVAQARVPIVLMHWAGPAPLGGQHGVCYTDVVAQVGQFLREACVRAQLAGIRAEDIWLDPGLGFGKSAGDAWALTARLGELTALGQPLVYGASRKGFLGQVLSHPSADRDAATAAACALAVAAGAQMVRVHAPGAVRDAVAVAWATRLARLA